MREAAEREAWNHTASIIAAVANSCRDPAQRRTPFSMREFHPYLVVEDEVKKKKTKSGKFDISILKSVFVDEKSMTEIELDHGV